MQARDFYAFDRFVCRSLFLVGLILSLGNLVVWAAGFIGWLVGKINAFQGKYFKLPVIGNLAERWSGSDIVAM
jgi:uncharacterized membrane protein